MSNSPTRRQLLTATTAALAASAVPAVARASSPPPITPNFTTCLNTATIRAQKLTLAQEIDLAIAAGYDGLEPWIENLQRHVKSGGSLADLAKKCADHNFKIYSAIGFAQWAVSDDAQRAKGLESAKADMDLVAQLGGTHIAAPPAGAIKERIELKVLADRYRALLEVGEKAGVIPQLEIWGFSVNVTTLADAFYIAAAASHPKACILPDVYHLYKGGSDPASLRLLSRDAVVNMHVNDYPATPPRADIKDSDRVYPGNGIAPYDKILATLAENGCHLSLSLEVFNPSYYKQDPALVARTGLAKIRDVIKAAHKP